MNPRIRILIGVVAVLVVVAALYKVALSPKYGRADALRAETATAQGVLDQARVQAKDLKTAKTSYSSDYTTLIRLGKAVPADDDIRSLLIQLEAAADRSEVDFISLTPTESAAAAPSPAAGSAPATQSAAAALPPGAAVGPAGLPTMPFAFEFSGSFLGLSEFFARLQRFVVVRGDGLDVKGRLLAVDGFSLKATNWPQMSASVGATAYLVKPGEAVDGAAAGAAPTEAAAPAATPDAATRLNPKAGGTR